MRPSLIQVTYETTFAEGKLRDDASARLSAALGIDIRPIELAQQPNQIEKREMISNYEEIREVAALALADVQRVEAYNRSRYRRLENVREMKLLAKRFALGLPWWKPDVSGALVLTPQDPLP